MCDRLSENDPNSYSNPEDCPITDMDINLEVDFKKHILFGYVDLSVEKKGSQATDLILDTRDLTIKGVKNKNTMSKMAYNLAEPHEKFGSKLEIKLPKRAAKKLTIRVEYETSPDSSALQWLEPEQTMGKKHPYVFSMCQAIHARSMLPCQDTPGVKFPYTATITVPYENIALMSAVQNGEEMAEDPLMKNFKFVQKVPVQSYLIALVIGDLESRKIGPRSHVWSERELVDKAAEEFSDAEKILKLAEDLMGEYVWEIYDILVLPPSFSFGGMENPCLTFVTPTILPGDKSQVDVIAHEITHSWTGNLVTNKNFEHFWLNEGFTTFLEKKMAGKMHGESMCHFEYILEWPQLEYEVFQVLGEKHDFTKLVVDLSGFDPDESFGAVPYIKGSVFLFYLEQLLGGPEVFEKFIKMYIEEHKYKSIDTDQWKDYLYKYFSDREDVLNKVDWDAWLYATGMPPVKPKFDSSLVDKCEKLSKAWIAADDNELGQFTPKDVEDFNSKQVQQFLESLLKGEPLSIKKIEKLAEVYKIGEKLNYEIKYRWIRLGLQAHWKEIIPEAVKLVKEVGRMKYVRPIYRNLYQWDETRELAISTFNETKASMMHATCQGVSRDLQLINPAECS